MSELVERWKLKFTIQVCINKLQLCVLTSQNSSITKNYLFTNGESVPSLEFLHFTSTLYEFNVK